MLIVIEKMRENAKKGILTEAEEVTETVTKIAVKTARKGIAKRVEAEVEAAKEIKNTDTVHQHLHLLKRSIEKRVVIPLLPDIKEAAAVNSLRGPL